MKEDSPHDVSVEGALGDWRVNALDSEEADKDHVLQREVRAHHQDAISTGHSIKDDTFGMNQDPEVAGYMVA